MTKRVRLDTSEKKTGGLYFKDKPVTFIDSGSTLLNLVLSGGYPLGRFVNIVGDKSTGKTLLAMEAFANFHRQFPDGAMYYAEVEAAFDKSYARSYGIPIDKVDFVEVSDDKDEGESRRLKTVEEWYAHLTETVEKHKVSKTPGLYVLDSLDSLSDAAELDRGFEEGTFGTGKAKNLSKLFRMIVDDVERTNICVIIVSQIRDKIGVSFGETKTRAGGRALDFYASQSLWLAHLGEVTGTWREKKRAIGVRVKAKCKKNKIGLPLRECEFRILFGYGVDDERSCLEWLATMKVDEFAGMTKTKAMHAIEKDRDAISQAIKDQTRDVWQEFDQRLAPPKKGKYTV